MILRKTKYLLGAGILLGSSLLSPASAFAEGSGTNGMSFYDYLASKADKDTVIDFNEAPATGNIANQFNHPISDVGGLYMLQSTKDDEKPVYFFRGNVEDNNVILNGFCWLMVCTTETGGTKLLYNGTPTADGQCLGDPDWTGEDYSILPTTVIGNIEFNANNGASPSDLYYMYGERYEVEKKDVESNYAFGNDVTFQNGVYALQDVVPLSESLNGHHYTCLSVRLLVSRCTI